MSHTLLTIAATHRDRASQAREDAVTAGGVAFLLLLAVAVSPSLVWALIVGTAPALLALVALAALVVSTGHTLAARRAEREHAARLAAPVSGALYALRFEMPAR